MNTLQRRLGLIRNGWARWPPGFRGDRAAEYWDLARRTEEHLQQQLREIETQIAELHNLNTQMRELETQP